VRVGTASGRQHGYPKGIVRCKHVVSTYRLITTYATYDTCNRWPIVDRLITTYQTYDTCNRWPLDVACGPRAFSVLMSHPSVNVAPDNTHWQKDARRAVTVA